MLELRNLTKVYKTKGGDVRALDGIDLIFPETGMIFLLGKSGSGKSTLLNVCGGLDDPTSGEIIVRGRSSATFSGSDFDSYRNTFIGFIFQEYNVLNEFSVEDNLAIALELQGKPKDRERVAELLKQVDMEGYAKRKPTTLSGGQKQRIAIARALIKDPKIIMADEPTGALDSATGKQVFDTLKSLSKDRLVIVVSHDREFAEYYGDRIIELKDGKVISDITKERVAPKELSENLVFLNENTLSVKEGAKLVDSDFKKINEFLTSGEGDLLITRGKESVESFKKANRIGVDGSSESFTETKKEKIEAKSYGKDDCKFVRSKLPIDKALMMGASSLKVKPFRLVLTILLSVTAFIFFGIVSTMMTYNEKSVVAQSFDKSAYNAIRMEKIYRYTVNSYNGDELISSYNETRETVMTEKDVAELNSKIGEAVASYYTFSSGNLFVQNLSAKKDTSPALTDFYITGFSPYSKAPNAFPIKLGRAPDAPDEIVISSFFAKTIASNEYYELREGGRTEKVAINADNEVIGRHLYINISGEMFDLKIVGVFDGGEMPAEFSGYDDPESFMVWDNARQRSYSWYIRETMQKVIAVSDDFYSSVSEKTGYKFSGNGNVRDEYNKYFTDGFFYELHYGNGDYYGYVESYAVYGGREMLPVYFFDDSKTALADDEMILVSHSLPTFELTPDELETWQTAHAEYADKAQEASEMALDAGDNRMMADYYDSLYEIYSAAYQNPANMMIAINRRFETRYRSDLKPVTNEELAEYVVLLKDYYCCDRRNKNLSASLTQYGEYGPEVFATMKVVGFYFDPSTYDHYYSTGAYVTQNFFDSVRYENTWREEIVTRFSIGESDIYYDGAFVLCGSGKRDNINKTVKLLGEFDDTDGGFTINNSLYANIATIGMVVNELLRVFLIMGCIFAVFAALLLFNFISVSINNKMHEIGVLRAVGARGADVFKIFFSESFIIAAICVILAVFGTIISLIPLNASITKAFTFSLQLFVFGPVSVLMLIGVALVVALLGTLLPVVRISKKKPVDSMKG